MSSLQLQFTTFSEMKDELGTMMAMLSFVSMVVLRARIATTSPVTSLTLDPVAHLDRPLGEDDEAADEVAGDVLKSEADANADRAG